MKEKYCIDCGEDENFAYTGTYANGDFWKCKACGKEFEHTDREE
jgi:transposase-like protein